MNKIQAIVAGLVLAATGAAWAQATPAGLWRTIDDESGKEKSLVRIVEKDGIFTAKVEKIADPAKAAEVCDKCSDERKGQPIVGMTILRNVKADAQDKELWDGGDILDPKNGKVYKVRLKPIEAGKKLEVRGYIGAPLFGRTQTWIRVE
ncbi:DUF2147 domain-containing protein [Ideonella sp. B7]|uniref:DUF2147 domain-containing protein n=1 Tax=Ideonella benzenivorans TaxID=2831643 RepID=UPI001CEC1D09|nr:DUF2147 domain-containing protein [Ideonella benzenivorans]MCA6217060.1 DUF2147 domain-containing protein [Ideonella benzenivorans]